MKTVCAWVLAGVLAAGLVASGPFGCAQPQSQATPGASPPTPAAQEPEPAPPAPPPLDPREERRLVKDLLRDVDEFHRHLENKAVEQAAAYVPSAQRQTYQDGLWEYVARYKIESADVASYQLFPQPDGVMAKVKVLRTVFERNSVVPMRRELWMTWFHRGDRWTLSPQERK